MITLSTLLMAWQIFSTIVVVLFNITKWLLMHSVTVVEFIIDIFKILVDVVIDSINFVRNYLIPAGEDVWAILTSPEAGKIVATVIMDMGVAFGFISMLFKDGFSVITNPFLFNLLSHLGTVGLTAITGIVSFIGSLLFKKTT